MNDKSLLGLNEIIGLIIHYFKYLKGVLNNFFMDFLFNGKKNSGSLANFAKFWENLHIL
jgi:hypothetical protein